MYDFILQTIIMLSLGTMIYLISRAAPRIGDEIMKPTTKFDRWFASLEFKKADTILSNFLEKLLRKIKLFLMKLDNITSNYLNKVKSTNGQKNRDEKPNLFSNEKPLVDEESLIGMESGVKENKEAKID